MIFKLSLSLDSFKEGFKYKGIKRDYGVYWKKNECIWFTNTNDGTVHQLTPEEFIDEEFEIIPK